LVRHVPGVKAAFSARLDLADQANSATVGHAKAAHPLTQAQREAMVQFEMGLFTAQVFDSKAKYLGAHGANGGPQYLVTAPFHFGINDVVSGDYKTGAPFNPGVFTLYNTWIGLQGGHDDDGHVIEARQAVARGQVPFNTKPIQIKDVKGLNDDLSVVVLPGTCTTCHDSPNAGDHSIPASLDIGLTDASRRTPDMPLYQLRNKTTGAVIATTDPGRALITGKWKDIGRFKGPILRGLAARAPYFHNGFAADLDAAVDFYNQRFDIGLTPQEHADLVAFLRTL
jgi:cytochrome c peroxidase